MDGDHNQSTDLGKIITDGANTDYGIISDLRIRTAGMNQFTVPKIPVSDTVRNCEFKDIVMNDRHSETTGFKVGEWISIPFSPIKPLPWWRRLLGQKPDPSKSRTFRVTAISDSSLTVEAKRSPPAPPPAQEETPFKFW